MNVIEIFRRPRPEADVERPPLVLVPETQKRLEVMRLAAQEDAEAATLPPPAPVVKLEFHAEPVKADGPVVALPFQPEPSTAHGPDLTVVVVAVAPPHRWWWPAERPRDGEPLFAGGIGDARTWLRRRGYRYLPSTNALWAA